jgi:hypothetical protein
MYITYVKICCTRKIWRRHQYTFQEVAIPNTENFLTLMTIHSSALHINQCTFGCGAHTNFIDESACLMADNVWNEGK